MNKIKINRNKAGNWNRVYRSNIERLTRFIVIWPPVFDK